MSVDRIEADVRRLRASADVAERTGMKIVPAVGKLLSHCERLLAALAAAEAERDEALKQRDHDYARFSEAKHAIIASDSARAQAEAELAAAEAENARLREALRGQLTWLGQGYASRNDETARQRIREALASQPDEEQACERCHGDGVITVGGASVNPHTGALGPDPQAAADVTCPDCGGTGEGAAT